MENDFEYIVSLWKNYNSASLLLTKALGGTANEVGEFAEILVANLYDGVLLPASNRSADIKTKDNKLIQVKSRKIEKLKTTSLNVIRSWEFDLLVVVLFSKDGNLLKAIEIDSATAQNLAKRNEHQNGKVLTTNHEFLNNSKAIDITERLQDLLNGKKQTTRKIEEFRIGRTGSHIRKIKSNIIEDHRKGHDRPPDIELLPRDITEFRYELLRIKKAKRIWIFQDGNTKSEIWNASNFSETSNIFANIKTNNTYRRWKELGIVKVRIEIDHE